MPAISKAERIRYLYRTGEYTTAMIAEVVGCLPEYVRVAARQRVLADGTSEIDRKYYARPENRERKLEFMRNFMRRRRAEARAS